MATGSSMQPFIYQGDKLYIEPARRNFSTGDVLVIMTQNKFIVHRLVRLKGEENEILILKGDNNSFDDPPVYEHSVIGRVYRVSPGIKRYYHRLRGIIRHFKLKTTRH